MRIRQLQTHLQDQGLIYQGKPESLRGLRVGIDATCWLRSIQMLKDPYADALGGCPPGLFGIVGKELENFQKLNIHPMFVFDGMVPPLQHQMFQQSPGQHHLEQAWTHLANNRDQDAQKSFAVATSRINSDICHFVFQYLKSRGFDCIRAPYLAGAQLAHMANENIVQAIIGQPGMLLYGIKKVILQVDFAKAHFEWIELEYILHQWGINKSQFVDSCLLAGTEYCLTYPYLNLEAFSPAPNAPPSSTFSFHSAVEFIKQTPLTQWMANFPTEEMRKDHVHGYCVTKTLLTYCPILNLKTLAIEPLTTGNAPEDLSALIGERLPNHFYSLLCSGHISYRIPSVLSTGEWNDRQPPLIDTMEYRSLLVELEEYRVKTLGLLAATSSGKKIKSKTYFDETGREMVVPTEVDQLKWKFTKEDLVAEMKRQKVSKVDTLFCIRWHAHDFENDGPLYKNLTSNHPSKFIPKDLDSTVALINFMLLESLDYISPDGGMTVLGDVLKDTPVAFEEPMLLALEMMKFGLLNGEPLEAPEQKPFPAAIGYPAKMSKSVLLISRVMSLVPIKLKNDLWSAKVDFDLAAFHCLVRTLNRTMRLIGEGCLGNVLSRDLTLAKNLPANTQAPNGSAPSDSLAKKTTSGTAESVLPSFMLPRACMGILAKFFLEYTGKPEQFEHDLKKKFPCAVDPVADLKAGFIFWDDLHRVVDAIAEPLGTTDMLDEIKAASLIITEKRKTLGISS